MHESHWSCVFLRGTVFFIVTIIPIEIPDSCRKIHMFMLCGLWNVAHEGSQKSPLPRALASTTPLVELDETD